MQFKGVQVKSVNAVDYTAVFLAVYDMSATVGTNVHTRFAEHHIHKLRTSSFHWNVVVKTVVKLVNLAVTSMFHVPLKARLLEYTLNCLLAAKNVTWEGRAAPPTCVAVYVMLELQVGGAGVHVTSVKVIGIDGSAAKYN